MDNTVTERPAQDKIHELVDCSFEVGRDLRHLSKVFAKAGMKERAAHLTRLAERILGTASLASVELVRTRS